LLHKPGIEFTPLVLLLGDEELVLSLYTVCDVIAINWCSERNPYKYHFK